MSVFVVTIHPRVDISAPRPSTGGICFDRLTDLLVVKFALLSFATASWPISILSKSVYILLGV